MPRHGRRLLTILVAHSAGPQGARVLDGHGHLFREPFPELAEDVKGVVRLGS